MNIEHIINLQPEQILELHQLELNAVEARGEARGERRAVLYSLGWADLTDEEVTWVCERMKTKGKFILKPTVDQIRQMIADENKEDKPRSFGMFDEGAGNAFKNLGDLETGLIP